jgi:hypothetical protein
MIHGVVVDTVDHHAAQTNMEIQPPDYARILGEGLKQELKNKLSSKGPSGNAPMFSLGPIKHFIIDLIQTYE